jgi:hypothetical protein
MDFLVMVATDVDNVLVSERVVSKAESGIVLLRLRPQCHVPEMPDERMLASAVVAVDETVATAWLLADPVGLDVGEVEFHSSE